MNTMMRFDYLKNEPKQKALDSITGLGFCTHNYDRAGLSIVVII